MPDTPAATRHAFRRAMSRVPAGVAIVTTRDSGGSDWGVTVTAFGLCSHDPPLLFVSLYRDAGSTPAFASAERFALSVLGTGHEELAERFATGRPDKFILGGLERAASGALAVPGAVAVIEARRVDAMPAGDHVVVTGEPERVDTSQAEPLAYARGEYAALRPLAR